MLNKHFLLCHPNVAIKLKKPLCWFLFLTHHHRYHQIHQEKELAKYVVNPITRFVQETMLDGEKAILEQKITAATARMNELRRTNREMEVKLVIYDAIAGRRKNLDDLSPNFIDDLQKEVAKRREEVQKRMQELCSMDSSKPTWRDWCMCNYMVLWVDAPCLHVCTCIICFWLNLLWN